MSTAVGSIDELWTEWGDALARYATVLVGPDDAPDLVDDTLVKVMVAWEADPGRRFELPYLLRTVLNEARMRHRSRSRRERREWRAMELPVHAELLSDPTVRQAVGRLSVMQRAVVYFTYWEDLTPPMGADRLGVTEGTVKRHLARARSKLREALA